MIIYNTTFNVPENLQTEFLDFMRNEYIPQVIQSDILKEPRLSRIFGREDDDGYSFALEFKADNIQDLEEWNKKEGKKLYFKVLTKFRQNILGFATLMQPINL